MCYSVALSFRSSYTQLYSENIVVFVGFPLLFPLLIFLPLFSLTVYEENEETSWLSHFQTLLLSSLLFVVFSPFTFPFNLLFFLSHSVHSSPLSLYSQFTVLFERQSTPPPPFPPRDGDADPPPYLISFSHVHFYEFVLLFPLNRISHFHSLFSFMRSRSERQRF